KAAQIAITTKDTKYHEGLPASMSFPIYASRTPPTRAGMMTVEGFFDIIFWLRIVLTSVINESNSIQS
ncbi:MAG TPA: hypothetical protein VE866_15525, partial [Candidatus Binatia bacterium]|nr:hypothetical protein [Candidatus Binatia bacterium]